MLNPYQSRAGRALLEWSQADLARRSNVSSSTVRSFEKGRRIPSINNLRAMRQAMEEAGISFWNDRRPGARIDLGPAVELAGVAPDEPA